MEPIAPEASAARSSLEKMGGKAWGQRAMAADRSLPLRTSAMTAVSAAWTYGLSAWDWRLSRAWVRGTPASSMMPSWAAIWAASLRGMGRGAVREKVLSAVRAVGVRADAGMAGTAGADRVAGFDGAAAGRGAAGAGSGVACRPVLGGAVVGCP